MTLVRLVTCMLSPNVPRSEPLSHVTSLAVFLMGALALVVPSGYSIGPVLLLLASAALLFKRFKCSSFVLLPQDRWIIVALVAYGLVVGVMSAVELGSRGFDRPLRFLLAIPVLLLILRYPPRLSWLWGGVARAEQRDGRGSARMLDPYGELTTPLSCGGP